jgi:integrase
MLMGEGWQNHAGLVFTQADGSLWHPQVLTRAFSQLVAKTKLPKLSLHGLRHTHATHLLAVGINPSVVSERLGHSSVAFTLDQYAHVMPGQQAEAAAAAAVLIAKSGS